MIEELIGLARQMREANARGEAMGLSEDEVAFYDALETNDSAVKVLGDQVLQAIARELVKTNSTGQRHHRLDRPGECTRPITGPGKTHPPQIRLPP